MNAADPFVRALTGDGSAQAITLIRTFRAPVAEVWDAITAPERIARWYGTITGPTPSRPGDSFMVDLGGGMLRRAVLESCDAPQGLTYTWWSGDDDPGLVRIRLDPDGAGTRLTVQHDRLRPHRMLQYGEGWEQNLVALAEVVGAQVEDAGGRAPRRWELLRAHPLVLERVIEAPVRAVWDAWAGADGLSAWWWNHWDDVAIVADVRPGGRYRIEASRHGIAVSGEYLAVEPERRLAFTWVWSDADGDSRDEAVDVAFEATGDGATAVTVRHTGPWDDDAPADSYRQGWDFVLAELAGRLG
ncbi:SRPBCC family protein [Microbacterium sulfonylureivorans]|uniref:SRPBCC family protein n=1 Tax=Microbacterium sulfonylureivorans TaxID=2486854 RepID=UPI000FDA6506|nr:SRPBCC family protein [Microbacterium sulfonylureivorans]